MPWGHIVRRFFFEHCKDRSVGQCTGGFEVYSLFGQKRTGLEQEAWEPRVLEVEFRRGRGALQVQTPDDHIQHSSHCSQLHPVKHGRELGGLQHGIHLDLGSRGTGRFRSTWGGEEPTTQRQSQRSPVMIQICPQNPPWPIPIGALQVPTDWQQPRSWTVLSTNKLGWVVFFLI